MLKVDFWIQGPAVADTLHSEPIFNQSESRIQLDIALHSVLLLEFPFCCKNPKSSETREIAVN